MIRSTMAKVCFSLLVGAAMLPAQAEEKLPPGHPPIGTGGGSDAGGPAPASHGGMGAAHGGMGAAHGGFHGMAEASPPPPLKDGLLDLGDVNFKVPASWTQETPGSSMRKAQFRLPKADGDSADGELAIFYFGPQAGGVEANVTRWYGQFEQPDGKSSEQVAKREKLSAGTIDVTVIDLSGTMKPSMMPGGDTGSHPGYRMLGAIAETPSGPWFAKATGPAKTMEKAASDFRAFALSVKVK